MVGIKMLKEGNYNEDQSHEDFLEALNGWRDRGKEEKKVKFVEVVKQSRLSCWTCYKLYQLTVINS